MRQQVSARYKDPETKKTWVVVHKARATYEIKRKAPKWVSESGWTLLGTITRYREPRGDGLRWKDLGKNESAQIYSSLQKCLVAFIDEMKRRRKESINAHV